MELKLSHTLSRLVRSQPQGNSLVGRRVLLRPIKPADYPWLLELTYANPSTFRWRVRPGSLNPDNFGEYLWRQVFTQFVVLHRERNTPLGLVVAYNADFVNRFAYIAAVVDPALHRVGWHLESTVLFITHLFQTTEFRKLYGETLDVDLQQYGNALRGPLHEEGRLQRHAFVDGEYRDLVIVALHREDWPLGTPHNVVPPVDTP